MKKLLLSTLIAVASLSATNAATTITATNYNLALGVAQQVVTDAGTATPYVGTYMIGTFSTTTGLNDTVGPINLGDYGWTMFGTPAAFEALASRTGLFGSNGVTADLPLTITGPFIGNNIFVVVANAANTDYIIWDSNQIFATEIEGVGGASVGISVLTAPTTLIRGIVVPDGNNGLTAAAGAANGQDAITFGAIPEPSVALLGAFGVLGLLRRRR